MTDRSLELFAARLDALGADLSRWPAGDAAQARALLARSADARALEASARRLDALVASASEADMPNGLAFRIVADVSARRADRLESFFGSPRRFGFASASFGAAAVAVGILIGAVVAPQPSDAASATVDFGPAFAVALADEDL